MAKINRVKASRSDLQCGKCKCEIPKGSAYIWGQGFKQPKKIRCTTCGLSAWELSGSAFIQAVGDLCENWQKNYEATEDGISSLISDLEELRDTCQNSLDNMPEGLQQGDSGNTLQERIDMLEDVISQLESIEWGDEPQEEEFSNNQDAFDEAMTSWLEDITNQVDEAISNLSY